MWVYFTVIWFSGLKPLELTDFEGIDTEEGAVLYKVGSEIVPLKEGLVKEKTKGIKTIYLYIISF